ncbi:MAG: glycosyltransferase [Anaerolineae bacterium]
MRIVMVGPFGFHPNKTMRSRALGFARELIKAGHPVKMIMPPWQTAGEANTSWLEDGVEIEYVSLSGGIIPTVGRMVRSTRQFKPDAVIGFKPKAYSGLTMLWLWATRWGSSKPLLVTDTDDWEGWGGWNDIADYSTIQKYFFAWQEKWGLRHCDLLTYASRELGNRALSLGITEDQTLYLPNGPGIQTEIISSNLVRIKRQELGLEDRPTLLLYSRLFEFDTGRLTVILQKVVAKVPNLAILAVGAGLFAEQAADFRIELETAGLLDHIIDTGWLDEDELPHTLTMADVGLYLMDDTLLNRTKCPVKLADMVALGLPIAAESVGEVTLYVEDGVNGFLCRSGDVDSTAFAIVNLLKNKTMAQQLGQAGRERHQQLFAWTATTQKLIKQLEAASI